MSMHCSSFKARNQVILLYFCCDSGPLHMSSMTHSCAMLALQAPAQMRNRPQQHQKRPQHQQLLRPGLPPCQIRPPHLVRQLRRGRQFLLQQRLPDQHPGSRGCLSPSCPCARCARRSGQATSSRTAATLAPARSVSLHRSVLSCTLCA